MKAGDDKIGDKIDCGVEALKDGAKTGPRAGTSYRIISKPSVQVHVMGRTWEVPWGADGGSIYQPWAEKRIRGRTETPLLRSEQFAIMKQPGPPPMTESGPLKRRLVPELWGDDMLSLHDLRTTCLHTTAVGWGRSGVVHGIIIPPLNKREGSRPLRHHMLYKLSIRMSSAFEPQPR
ncbi:hypothetical protein PG987_011281 [Apiospora arundinis]